ncbi:FAD-dependent monooxygenase [uncultured Tateyamaria sp.]|uniref:FAD-dependent monooxygenase n=1 Tax=uncultured Tateyamaria sp. TaxID=455651 RepID=UPI0026152753|nr:FAD-dependent monooxygenase [uncultured Tateyamaria sp.]
MQYHLNGFRPGDPNHHPAADTTKADTDVLIVGTGSAGLTLAAYLAQFPHIRTRIVEQRDGPLIMGQADGIACRTMEMFEAFGFAHLVNREAYHVNETTFWNPDAGGNITRTGRIDDVEEGLSEQPHVILSQARVHDFYLDLMRNAPTRLEPEYGTQVTGLTIHDEGRVTVDTNHGLIQARYVIGCDGARSAVRKALEIPLKGEAENAAWGVMDILATTDFPDIRLKTAIQSKDQGSLLIIPREGGYMVRFYIELAKLNPNERVADRDLTPDDLIAAAKRILAPYTLDVKDIVWWSVYEIGQRVTDQFADTGPDDATPPRVFIAGDACHTHSPKAGQGMNVSMQDAFNLGWKLQTVLEGRASPDLLHTYSAERQAIAQDLINFDRDFARAFAARGQDPQTFQNHFQKHARYTAGVETRYAPGHLTGPNDHQALATGFTIGKRFHSAPVIRWADAKPIQLGHTVMADGRWRLFHFAGDTDHTDALTKIIASHTPENHDPDSIIDMRTIVQTGHRETHTDIARFPTKGALNLRDMEKLFCPDPDADIFDMRGIDRKTGALVLVRPDQYVSHVLPPGQQDALVNWLTQIFGDKA